VGGHAHQHSPGAVAPHTFTARAGNEDESTRSRWRVERGAVESRCVTPEHASHRVDDWLEIRGVDSRKKSPRGVGKARNVTARVFGWAFPHRVHARVRIERHDNVART